MPEQGCPNCGAVSEPGDKFCVSCGALRQPAADQPAPAVPMDSDDTELSADQHVPPAEPYGAETEWPAADAATLAALHSGSASDPDGAGDPETLGGEPADGMAHPSRVRKWVRRITVVGLYSLALTGLGVVIGWQVFSRVSPPPPTTEVVEVPIVAAQLAGATMPEVRGLTEDVARTALVDAGVPADRLTVETRPAAGRPGVVIDQVPAFGSSDLAEVSLVISTEAAVPDLAGKPESEASAELIALGTRVEVRREYDPQVEPGLAIGTDPAPGGPLGDAVTLIIAEPAASAYLTQLDTVDDSDSCSQEDQAVLAGAQYDDALSCTADEDTREYVWLMAGRADRFEAVIGVPDDGDQGARAVIQVLVDGQERASGVATYTSPVPINVDVTGGTQLQIRLTNPNPDTSSYSNYVDVVLGDGRLIGSRASIDELAGWSQ